MRRPPYALRLRMQLVLASALAVCIVLGCIVIVTDVIGRATETQNADAVLDAIVEDNGESGSLPPQATVMQYGRESTETLQEARYFTVELDSAGTVTGIHLGNATSVSEDDARALVDQMHRQHNAGSDRGTVGDYRYRTGSTASGSYVVFLDRGRQNLMLHSIVTIIGAVSVVAALFTILIVFLLSKRIVQPILENNAKQRRFVTDAGHDIKTPLTIISADTDVLRMDVEAAGLTEDFEWTDDIKRQVTTLTDLTNRLIYISKMEEADELAARSVEFCLSDVVSEEVRSFRSRARTGGRTLEADVEPGLRMRGDEAAVAQMVRALLDNAFKYSNEGGAISVTLRDHPRSVPRSVRLTVYNTADEVDRKAIAHWFDRFYQADEARTHREGGFGIGLSMVQAVVAAHGGRVQGTTRDGRSVSIEVTLPTRLTREERKRR